MEFSPIVFTILFTTTQGSIYDAAARTTIPTISSPDSITSIPSPTTTTAATPTKNVFLTILENLWQNLRTISSNLEKAVKTIATLSQNASLEKLQDIKREITQLEKNLKNTLSFNNITKMAHDLDEIGQKLLGISGNATELKQQLLNMALEALIDGTLCKSPAELIASIAQGTFRLMMENIPNILNGVEGNVDLKEESLVSAAGMMSAVAKAAEGAGVLSRGLGIALGVSKCLRTFVSMAATIGSGGALAPIFLVLG